ncbi:MAG: 4-hydroxybutyrate--acetyl-CoA CoA transferase [Thermotogae bacterium]|uniref:acetyl-CoA hydrolase/transferase family protein n=1 Tax=Kosmotoga sp. TaxID=1955248 RepID=UPI000F1FFAD7|nr:acetyl-CoA hydrolase/transferase C-terminal domain-containing protein [Kosmotoga sp.]MBO8166658.1 acetyl-CoA hydrolase/transferase family protein [Kosmotoga sp.]RKX50503.1 MAG: 4-hydroxybutyrate--acetyl-CoA CoA transferase [Thermotogota bacterium]
MNWKELYKKKLLSLDDALGLIKSNHKIVVSMVSMEPKGLLDNLHKLATHVEGVSVTSCLNMREYPFFMDPQYNGTFINESWFYSAPVRKAAEAGYKTVSYIPNNLHNAGTDRLVSNKPDIFWGVASPMDRNGYMTLSLSNVYERDMVENADMVILEVNEKAPKTHGETQVHISEVDHVIENSFDIPELPVVEPSETEKHIARHISELIEDGATLQIGIGGIPNAVAKLLEDKRDLGIHTEMFTESMIELFEKGIITNSRKTLWPGKFICTFALGTKKMYKFVEDNPGIFILRGRYVNDPYVIAQNEKMVSINTAITVDLTGQVCSEAIGTRHYSGTGGQLDTHRGASMSKGGKGIIALRTTAKRGTISTIVPLLPLGSPVTVPRQDIDYVVTEYGIAHLRGLSVKQRAEALVNIAHPDFRNQLRKEASKLNLI